MQIKNCHGWDSNPGSSECESSSKPTEPLMSSSVAQLVCCLTHILRSLGSNPSHGNLLFVIMLLYEYAIKMIMVLISPKEIP